ncbi:hypothetical protein PUNSTDRAFT_103509 [Punctularia strigosozonata HHB-11173 SS5]|uniref:uncharacterized protein n=1 Tax=Punctularia strigosozonata (strain HHB-11173) TaxID=741275 RepID=UPI0004417874|nr:uncharacterized protein PUNSTDRAFT_103509 [Punctularia strigosozonata HHB-11173 SS5]EIN08622.1 hypothetical protein PUNSTDRAFT_103509 [Punctularia strigosozonata HHB-11173 SS5]
MDQRDHKVPDEHHVPRTGHWLSQDKRHHHDWMKKLVNHVDNPKELHPVLQQFRDKIEGDSRLYMLFNCMFERMPSNKKYLKDPTGENPQVRDVPQFLALLNHVISTPPAWTDAGHLVGFVGAPINALLNWPMATRAGFAVFQDPEVNAMIKKVLDAWGAYLKSEASCTVLDDGKTSWFGEHGVKNLEEVGNLGKSKWKFEEMYVCEPEKPYKGFKSWDDFFTRRFRDGIRPVASPDDPLVIANPCESMPYKIATDVHARAKFWVKGQPYSVTDMLASHPSAPLFVGGTVYQAFLSALSYHRWHSPVTGVVKETIIVPGTYYSEPLFEDFEEAGESTQKEGLNVCQEYLSVMATRAIIFIEADEPRIGLVAFLGVGMAEMSTCEVTVKEGQKIKKGDELGMFHFGGSTMCCVFRKGVRLEGFPQPGQAHNVPVRAQLAKVVG